MDTDVAQEQDSASTHLLTAHDMPAEPPAAIRSAYGEPPHPKRRYWGVWIILVLIALVAGGYIWYSHHQKAQSTQTRPGPRAAGRSIPVVAVPARSGDLPIYLTGLGTVTPLNTVTVRSRVDGQIIKVAYREGQSVQAGDPLVEIDPRPFQVQLAQAQGQYAKDQALLKNAQLDLERYKSAKAALTQQQIDTQAALVQQYQGTLQSDQAQIDNARLQIAYCHITAPISGRTGLRLVDEGNMVHASDATGLVVITQLHPIAVVFTLPQDQVARVLVRMKASPEPLPVEVYNRDLTSRLAAGSLSAVDNQVDPGTGTVRLKATFSNEEGLLFPNQFVNARLLVDTLGHAILIPAAAVQRGPDGNAFVYVVKPDKTVEVRSITLGPSEADIVAVKQGLNVGDLVVTDGVDKLQEGTRVTVGQGHRGGSHSAATRSAGSTTRQAGQGGQGGYGSHAGPSSRGAQ